MRKRSALMQRIAPNLYAMNNKIGDTSWPGGGFTNPDFVFTVETTGASESFTIPCADVGVFNAVIDWGDGGPTSDITTYNDADLAHTYAVAGTYTITVSGTFPNIYFNNTGGDKDKVITVENFGTVGWLTFQRAFNGCGNLASVVAGTSDTSGCTVLNSTFTSCVSLITLDLSGLDTSNVTNMGSMCNTCNSMTTIILSSFDTVKVTNMSNMFLNNSNLIDLDVSHFNIAALTSASGFMSGFGMTTEIYDATLINWEAQPHNLNVTINFGTSKYTGAPSPAATARAALVSDGWTITDGGEA